MTNPILTEVAALALLLGKRAPHGRSIENIAEDAAELCTIARAHRLFAVRQGNGPVTPGQRTTDERAQVQFRSTCAIYGIALNNIELTDPRGGFGAVLHVDGWPSNSFTGGWGIGR